MSNPTFQLYHYESPKPAELISSNKEPYIVTEQSSDIIEVTTLDQEGTIHTRFALELNLVVEQLEYFGCPSNDFIVPNTTEKVSIVNGRKVFALSACELATLINLQASGYIAENREGFLVLKTVSTGAVTQITLNSGTIDPVLGLSSGSTDTGANLEMIIDVSPSPMNKISTGKYLYPNLILSDSLYSSDKRYYVNYKAVDPDTSLEKIKEEDFIIIKQVKPKLNYSFTR